MKKLFSLLAIVAIIAVSNCTRVPENDDPILGIWSKANISSETKVSVSIKEEWIFNDAYLGRYHKYSGNKITFSTDFRWEVTDGVYNIFYGEVDMPEVNVIMDDSGEPQQLQLTQGEIFAIRE
ncbi:hypothetical protein [uncultured Croceitalea sp.]|uniref:hypothetical protein n=1 Tax=uncultured Croceitalea sp. TaxID=1798908 RepID=UPI0033068D2F